MIDSDYWDKLWSDQPAMQVNSFARRAYKRIRTAGLKTLLDLGCGSGQDSRYFARKGLQVTALDSSSAGLKILQQDGNGISCLNLDIRNLDFPEESFDVVYSHLSLQYFDDPTTRRAYADIFRILKTRGLFFVKCKSTDDELWGKGEKIGEDIFINTHVRHFYSRAYMAAMLHQFQIISLRRTSSFYGRHHSSFIEAIATKR